MAKPIPPPYLAKVTLHVHGKERQGSAVFLSPALAVTCLHVIYDEVRDSSIPKNASLHIAGMDLRARVEHPDKKRDLVLLKLDSPAPDVVPIPWNGERLTMGDKVQSLGFPNGEFIRADHLIKQATVALIQIDASVDPGASGGALVFPDALGSCCVGILQISRKLDASGAIPFARVKDYLEEHGEEFPKAALPPAPTRVQNPSKYLTYLRDETGRIELGDISPQGGSLYVAIDRIWVPARPRGGGEKPVPLDTVVNEHRVVAIEGEAGSGKSTFLKRIAFALVRTDQKKERLKLEFSGLPLWLQITRLETYLTGQYKDGPPKNPDPRWITRCFADMSAAGRWKLDAAFFEARVTDPESILLLDGLDEASAAWRPVLARLFVEAARAFECRMAITTRPEAEFSKPLLSGVKHRFSILEMEPEEMSQFIRLWTQSVKSRSAQESKAHADALRRNLKSRPEIRRMARNPMMLTMLASLTRKSHELPEERAQLFKEIVDWMASSRYKDPVKAGHLKRVLSLLALEMIRRKGGNPYQVGFRDAEPLILEEVRPATLPDARAFLEEAEANSRIITMRGGDLVFRHRSFQEYLAAQRLSDLPDRAKIAQILLEGRQVPEVLRLLAGCMAQGASQNLADLLLHLIRSTPEDLEPAAYAVGVIGGMLADVRVSNFEQSHGFQTVVKEEWEKLSSSTRAIFRAEGKTVPPKVRAAAAEALAQGGWDERLMGPHDPRYWVRVEGGTFRMGESGKTVTLTPFEIGRFPVTVKEYDDYLCERDLEPDPDMNWEEQRKHPSRPVVWVTWKEARDYCASIPGGSLPTEERWEFAARGTEGRVYPWGKEEPNPERASYDETGLGDACPVGLFPQGRVKKGHGIFDMAGNVWEWTDSSYRKDDPYKVLRGGAFSNESAVLRAAYRGNNHPGFRDDIIGFRCVREVSS
jgi:formylglycine-generating enzyme required for sulfatase activity